MTDTAALPGPWRALRQPPREAERVTTGPPRRVSGPVLIGDAISCWGGRPMLLRVMEDRPDD